MQQKIAEERKRILQEKIQNMRLIDDLMFRWVIDSEPELIGKLISAVLKRPVRIKEVQVQKTRNNQAGKEVIEDAEAVDEDLRKKVKMIKEGRQAVKDMCETLETEYKSGMEKGIVLGMEKCAKERNELRTELDEKNKTIDVMKEMLQKVYGPDIMNIVAELASAD